MSNKSGNLSTSAMAKSDIYAYFYSRASEETEMANAEIDVNKISGGKWRKSSNVCYKLERMKSIKSYEIAVGEPTYGTTVVLVA